MNTNENAEAICAARNSEALLRQAADEIERLQRVVDQAIELGGLGADGKGVGWFCAVRSKDGLLIPFPCQLTDANGEAHESVLEVHRDGKQIYPAHLPADEGGDVNK